MSEHYTIIVDTNDPTVVKVAVEDEQGNLVASSFNPIVEGWNVDFKKQAIRQAVEEAF